MFLFGIIGSILGAIVVAVILWVLCAFSGKLVNTNFSMSMLQHLFCFVIAIPTVILLAVAFSCNKLNRVVTQAENGVAQTLMADKYFVEQLNKKIKQVSSVADTEELEKFMEQSFAANISKEYPILGKYANVSRLNLDKHLAAISQSGGVEMIRATTAGFVDGIRSKIKSTRCKAVIPVILLQAVAFGAAFYMAGKRRSQTNQSYAFESTDYI